MKLLARLIKILSGVQMGAEQEIGRLEQFAHFCVLGRKSFVRNRCPVRAGGHFPTRRCSRSSDAGRGHQRHQQQFKEPGRTGNLLGDDKFIASLMPPATAKGRPQGVAAELKSLSIMVTPTNAVVSKISANFVTNTVSTIETANTPASDTPAVSVSVQKDGGKSIP